MKALKLFIIFMLILASFMPVLTISTASSINNGVIFRANVNEMYIENQPMPVQIQALYFQNSIPQMTSVEISITLTNLSSNQQVQQNFNVSSGVMQTIYMQGLPPGEYSFTAEATAMGYSSPEFSEQFLVAPPPVPYSAVFENGGYFSFHSDVLNATGHYNKNYTFTILVYYEYVGGQAQLMNEYTNVTNISLSFPNDGQIVVINIIDRYGWINGMNINPAQGIFVGTPYIYNFNVQGQQPFASIYVSNFIYDAIVILIIMILLIVVVRRIRR